MSAEIMTSQATIESALCVPKENLNSRKDNSSSATVSKKKNKKGGLSMFLSGALDDFPKYIAPPPQTPKSEGPAWGGAKISMGFASLRDIQDEQIKIKERQPTRNKDHSEDPVISKSDGKILLSSFLPSKPIPVGSVPVVPAPASLVSEGERSTPPWTASGTPPLLSRPSLRDIQMQQVLNRSLFVIIFFFVLKFYVCLLSCFCCHMLYYLDIFQLLITAFIYV